MKPFCLFIFLYLSTLHQIFSQEFQFKQISGIDGLHSNTVSHIIQDSYGFMWFATDNGLSKYDGYDIVTFTNNNLDSTSINNNYIISLLEDTIPGNLWIGTEDGLNYYDSSSGIFLEFHFKEDSLIDPNFRKITTLYWGAANNLWVGVNNKIVQIEKNLSSNIFKTTAHKITPESNINQIIYWQNNKYFILKPNGLFVFDVSDYSQKKIRDGSFICALKDKHNNYWFGTRQIGLWCLPKESNAEFKQVTLTNNKLNQSAISAIAEDVLGQIWISVRDKGIEIINEQIQLSYNLNTPKGLKSNAGQCIYTDKHQNIWIGTSDAGVLLLDHNRKAFKHYAFNFQEEGLKNNNIRCMYQDGDSDIWIGTKVGGCLSKFDKETGTFEHFEKEVGNTSSLNDDFVFCIAEDKPGFIWVGTFHGGLNLLHKETGEFTRYPHDPNNPNSVSDNAIYTLCKDSKDRLWVGTDYKGLDVFDQHMMKKKLHVRSSQP